MATSQSQKSNHFEVLKLFDEASDCASSLIFVDIKSIARDPNQIINCRRIGVF